MLRWHRTCAQVTASAAPTAVICLAWHDQTKVGLDTASAARASMATYPEPDAPGQKLVVASI